MRLSILISAYYCSPYRGGESAVGWRVATGLAKYHDVTVICGDLSGGSPTGQDVARYAEEKGLPSGLKIHHIQAVGLARKIHDLHALPGLWFLYYEAYRRWQLKVLELAKSLHAENPFDVVHHLTIIGYREPGYLWQLGIPFFWGPVAGASMVPITYLADFGLKERFRWVTHRVLNTLQMKRRGRTYHAAHAAEMIWVVDQANHDMFRKWGVHTEHMSELGCLPNRGIIRTLRNGEPLKICWSGLCQGIKALPLLLRALATAASQSIELDVMGDGPEILRWKNLSHSLGLNERVRWHGMLPRAKALEVMQQAHVLVHTSLKEASASVVFEAIEMGLPVICHDACGMGICVNETCGIKVPLINPETSIMGFTHAINQITSTPDLLQRLSSGALKRAGELTWEGKILRYIECYQTTLGA